MRCYFPPLFPYRSYHLHALFFYILFACCLYVSLSLITNPPIHSFPLLSLALCHSISTPFFSTPFIFLFYTDRASSYFLTKTFLELPLTLVQTFVQFIICYFMINMQVIILEESTITSLFNHMLLSHPVSLHFYPRFLLIIFQGNFIYIVLAAWGLGCASCSVGKYSSGWLLQERHSLSPHSLPLFHSHSLSLSHAHTRTHTHRQSL